MDSIRDVVLLDRRFKPELIDSLCKVGWQVIAFKGGESAESLFHVLKQAMPLDPPISGNVHWDALSDSLFGGIDSLGASSAAIVWEDADRLLATEPSSFADAQEILANVAANLRHDRKKHLLEAKVRSFLLGNGPAFLPLRHSDLDIEQDDRPVQK